ncbi:MAG: hypothetical protein ACTHK8_18780 [Ginsengibacter sp.]
MAQIERDIERNFKDKSEIKKKNRLYLDTDIETALEHLRKSKRMKKLLLIKFKKNQKGFYHRGDSGLLVSKGNILGLIRIGDEWFTVNETISASDILQKVAGPALQKHLYWKTLRILATLKNANDYTEVKHLDNPVRIK